MSALLFASSFSTEDAPRSNTFNFRPGPIRSAWRSPPLSNAAPCCRQTFITSMSTESTPLSAATDFLNRDDVQQGVTFAKDELSKLGNSAKRGELSIRFLAFCGAVAIATTSLLGLFGRFLTFHWFSAVIDIYLILLGLLVIFLEGKRWASDVPQTKSVQAYIRKYALFLEFIWGRGCLYFVIGSLKMAQNGPIDLLVGGFMCGVGITYIVSGRRTATRLSKLRKTLYSESQLRDRFRAADVQNRGTIDSDQFRSLLQQIGVVLTITEAESAFFQIEKRGAERISFEQFKHWWLNAELDADQNANFAISV